MPDLPKCHNLDVSAFAQTLSEKNITSVNALWFLSILDILRDRSKKSNNRMPLSENKMPLDENISLDEISHRMVEIAIPPLYKFRLRFGRGEGRGVDQTKKLLDVLFEKGEYKDDMPVLNPKRDNVPSGPNENVRRYLEKDAPYLWLTPFLKKDLKNVKKAKKNGIIKKLASDKFSNKSPVPYRITGEGENLFIEFDDAWKSYIVSNIELIHGWAIGAWANFLQDKNPWVLNIVIKLTMRSKKPSVRRQRNFWNKVLCYKKELGEEFCCIYSKRPIIKNGKWDYDLDHYIPYSYIGHCHLWNLIPVATQANRIKGSKLPDTAAYLCALVKAQHDALRVYRTYFSPNQKRTWKDLVVTYSEDLSITEAELACKPRLCKSYEDVMKPTIELAEKSGFTTNWKWNNGR